MIKQMVGTFVIIGLLIGLMPALPVQAQQQGVALTHILAGVSGGATQEFIAVRNTSDEYVDITDWCLYNKNNIAFVCVGDDSLAEGIELPPGGVATFGSTTFVAAWTEVFVGWEFDPSNQSSGSLVGSNDLVEVRAPDGTVIDAHSWTTTVSNGSWLVRADDDTLWYTRPIDTFPYDSTERYTIEVDFCPNIDGIQASMPDNTVYDALGNCVQYVPPIVPALYITELMINPKGTDAGLEWIELWNAGTESISFVGIQVQLGNTGSQLFALDVTTTVEPGEYYILDQSQYDFSLTNTGGIVRLVSSSGEHIFATEAYTNAKDDQTWALFETGWGYTTVPTPGSVNVLPSIVPVLAIAPKQPVPCRADQYRSPETNRCRLLPRLAAPAPCKEGQYRSAETNRCRNVVAVATPVPCKQDQERNPETGRCRKIRELISANYEVLGVQSEARPQQWYGLAVLGVVVLGLVGYVVWEWRQEIGHFGRTLWARLAGGRK